MMRILKMLVLIVSLKKNIEVTSTKYEKVNNKS